MEKEKKRIKVLELEVSKLKQMIVLQIDKNAEQHRFNIDQSQFNQGLLNNINALGRKVFPEQFEKEKSGIILPGG